MLFATWFRDAPYVFGSVSSVFSTQCDPDHCDDFSQLYNFVLCTRHKLILQRGERLFFQTYLFTTIFLEIALLINQVIW